MVFFKEFIQQTDERQLDMVYQKARIAVDMVRMYNPKLLENIATIADLPSGAYGVYNSGENKKILPQETEKALIGWGRVGRHNLDMLPLKMIQQYYPQIPISSVRRSNTIRVNVRRILSEFPDDANRIIQIASTIVHEATHEMEHETLGQTTDVSAYAAEKQFMEWLQKNWQSLTQKYPELSGNPRSDITEKH